MRMPAEMTRKIWKEHGSWVMNACDKCGKILTWVRFTTAGKRGEYCSYLCRDGVEHVVYGICQACGFQIKDARKGQKFCSATCRKRGQVSRETESPKVAKIGVNQP